MRKHRPAPFKVLLVDDNPEDVDLLRQAAADSMPSAQVTVIDNGAGAIESLDRRPDRPPSLILLDLKLHGLSGLDVLSWIRERPAFANVPVVMLTGSSDPADVLRALSLGANSYLVKPGSGAAFMDMIRSVLKYWAGYNLTAWWTTPR